jgi:hypothetical protein
MPNARNLQPIVRLITCLVLLAVTCCRVGFGQANVLTYHNDNARTGQNLVETTLTLSNVNASSFGKLFTVSMDGQVYAQPLYVSALNMPGYGARNVVFAATEHDSVYAFDADNGTIYWRVSMLNSGETSSDPRNCTSQISPEIGVTGTPVIDLTAGSHGTMYVTAMSKDGSGNYYQRIHALDVTTGAEEFGGPVNVAAKYPGTGDNSSNGYVVFDPKQYKSRPGLLLLNGIVYTAWGSHCDDRPYTGWLIGYNESTLQQTSVFDFAPNGNDAAIWAAGGGVAADASGNIFIQLANGTFDTTLNAQGFPVSSDFGNAFVKLVLSGGNLTASDYWTMDNTVSESNADEDLGSGGLLLLPDVKDGNGNTWHLGTGAGKDGNIYVFDRDNMGKFQSNSNSNLYQELAHGLAGGEFATPAWFNGTVYYGALSDYIRAYTLSAARFPSSPTAMSPNSFGYPGTTPSISANGTSNAILWALENASPAVLHAYQASNIATELYNTNMAASGRDQFGSIAKFVVPTIANGKVFVGTTNSVAVFGLLSQQTQGPVPNGQYNLTNDASGMVLDDPAFSTAAGTQIIQWPANGGANQKWQFVFQPSGYYTIQNVYSELYLTDPGDSSSPGTALEQDPATNDSSQLWSLTASGGGYVVHNKGTGLVMDDPAASKKEDTGIILYTVDGGINQTWSLTSVGSGPIANGTYTLVNGASGLYLADPAASTTPGTQIIQWTATGRSEQQWNFVFQSSGYYTIQNVASGLYLGDPGDSSSPGTALEQLNATNDASQLWSLIQSGSAYVLENKGSGLVIDDAHASSSKGNGMILYTPTGGSNQSWTIQ